MPKRTDLIRAHHSIAQLRRELDEVRSDVEDWRLLALAAYELLSVASDHVDMDDSEWQAEWDLEFIRLTKMVADMEDQ